MRCSNSAHSYGRGDRTHQAVVTKASSLEDFIAMNNRPIELNHPTLDVGFVIVDYDEYWHAFAYTCMGGTYVCVNFAEASRVGLH